jgi:hypothetical protein
MPRKRNNHAISGVLGEPVIRRYLVSTGHNGRIDHVVMTRDEKDALTRKGIDFDYDRASGYMFIRLANGKPREFQGNCPLGSETYGLLERVLLAGSDFVPLVSENWCHAQVSRIRRVFEDPPGQDHFFEVQKWPEYALRLKPGIRWRIITVWRSDAP